jgi:predicted amidophosphoribosyltransferase
LLSAAAIAKPPVYDRARAAARYSATMRELIQSFKYRDRHEGLPLFGLWLKKAGAELLADADLIRAGATLSLAPLVAAVQSVGHARAKRGPARQRSRRLLRARPRAADIKPSRAFCRTKAEECRRSVQDAAGARRRVKGKSIVVVDDVITTGATAEACARALKRAGAAKVDVLALARAVEPPPSCFRLRA